MVDINVKPAANSFFLHRVGFECLCVHSLRMDAGGQLGDHVVEEFGAFVGNLDNVVVDASHLGDENAEALWSESRGELVKELQMVIFGIVFTPHVVQSKLLLILQGSVVVDEHVIVRGEQGAAAYLLDDMLNHGVRDGIAVEGRRAAAKFVHDNERMTRRLVENRFRFFEFDEEGALVLQDPITRSNSREHAIHNTHFALVGWYEAADLGQDRGDARLPQEGALTAHVWASDQEETGLVLVVIEAHLAIVRDELLGLLATIGFEVEHELHGRMSHSFQVHVGLRCWARIGHHGSRHFPMALVGRQTTKGAEAVQLSDTVYCLGEDLSIVVKPLEHLSQEGQQRSLELLFCLLQFLYHLNHFVRLVFGPIGSGGRLVEGVIFKVVYFNGFLHLDFVAILAARAELDVAIATFEFLLDLFDVLMK